MSKTKFRDKQCRECDEMFSPAERGSLYCEPCKAGPVRDRRLTDARVRANAHYYANKERHMEQSRQWAKKNPEKRRQIATESARRIRATPEGRAKANASARKTQTAKRVERLRRKVFTCPMCESTYCILPSMVNPFPKTNPRCCSPDCTRALRNKLSREYAARNPEKVKARGRMQTPTYVRRAKALAPGAEGFGRYSPVVRGRFAEFENECVYNFTHPPGLRFEFEDGRLEMEHVVPLRLGKKLGLTGLHHPDNIVPACRGCNHAKKRKVDAWIKDHGPEVAYMMILSGLLTGPGEVVAAFIPSHKLKEAVDG